VVHAQEDVVVPPRRTHRIAGLVPPRGPVETAPASRAAWSRAARRGGVGAVPGPRSRAARGRPSGCSWPRWLRC